MQNATDLVDTKPGNKTRCLHTKHILEITQKFSPFKVTLESSTELRSCSHPHSVKWL